MPPNIGQCFNIPMEEHDKWTNVFISQTCKEDKAGSHSISVSKGADCPICQEAIIDDVKQRSLLYNEQVLQHECGRIFHASCFEKWASTTRANCPWCRGVLKCKNTVEEEQEVEECEGWLAWNAYMVARYDSLTARAAPDHTFIGDTSPRSSTGRVTYYPDIYERRKDPVVKMPRRLAKALRCPEKIEVACRQEVAMLTLCSTVFSARDEESLSRRRPRRSQEYC